MANENESGSEKTEKPTSKRIKKSREEGQVAKSQEVISIGMLLICFISLFFYGSIIKDKLALLMMTVIKEACKINLSIDSIHYYFTWGIWELILMMLPIMAVFVGGSIILNVMQFGLLFTPKVFKPKFDRVLDISKGFKKLLLNQEMIFNLVKDLLKLVVIAIISYFLIEREITNYISWLGITAEEILSLGSSSTFWIVLKVVLVLILVAVADYIYRKWKHKKDLMMTKQEVKEERKQADLAPEVRQQLARRRMESHQKNLNKQVPSADVIITNPIHVAVAIKYDAEKMTSPIVVAKGLRLIAEKIKDIARQREIPIMENPPLARSLYKKIDVGQAISSEFYKGVAEVLAYVYQLNKIHKDFKNHND